MKRLLILLLACCVFGLSGCGGETGEDIKPGSSVVESSTGIGVIENAQLAENLTTVCKQIGVEVSEITDMKKTEDRPGGLSYSFTYKGLPCNIFCNTDNTVEAFCVGEQASLFDRRIGTYHIDDYIPEPAILAQTEDIARDILKKQYGVEEMESLPLFAWETGKICSVYSILGAVITRDASGKQDTVPFSFYFEHIPEKEELQLRYYSLAW